MSLNVIEILHGKSFKMLEPNSACTIINLRKRWIHKKESQMFQLRLVSCMQAGFPKEKKDPQKHHSIPKQGHHPHRILLPPATVSNVTLGANRSMLPPASHWFRFLHWDTSNARSLWQPSTMASTPTPVTRTHPRTDSSSSSSKWSPMLRSEESLTALPQNDRLRRRR